MPILILVLIAFTALFHSTALAQSHCAPGFGSRNAFAGDAICVSPQRQQAVSDENAAANANRSPTGGPWGPDTCRTGYVWRLASPKDLVCVIPESRDVVARENADPNLHAAARAPESNYEYSEWSNFAR